MAKLYYRKITAGDINPATSAAWAIDDVPARWRDEVQALLSGNSQESMGLKTAY